MDANGLRSFAISYDRGLYPRPVMIDGGSPQVTVEAIDAHVITAVQLASRTPDVDLREVPVSIAAVQSAPSIAIDAAGNYVTLSADGLHAYSVSALADTHPDLQPLPIALPVSSLPVRDLAFGTDDVLYVAGGTETPGIALIDMRARFAPTHATSPAPFQADCLAALNQGGVIALDFDQKRLARLHGLPFFTRGVAVYRDRDDRFDATEPNATPLLFDLLAATFAVDEFPRALAVADDGSVAVLCLVQGGAIRVRLVMPNGSLSTAVQLQGPRFAHAIGWIDNNLLAVMTDGVAVPQAPSKSAHDPGAFVYKFAEDLKQQLYARLAPRDASLMALGDFYPLTRRVAGAFAVQPASRGHVRSGPRLFYPRAAALGLSQPIPLARISLPARARYGAVSNAQQPYVPSPIGLIDTRNGSTQWHRLYVEAEVPRGCAMIIWLAANDREPPSFDATLSSRQPGAQWFPHLVGDKSALPAEIRDALPTDTPRAAWLQDASEVPLGKSLIACPATADVTGLFTVLIQRADTSVRTVRGRRLWSVVELFGDGRQSPELVALRFYAGRFSYRDRYLPALYREQIAGWQADQPGPATGADFLERFIDLFEGVFTTVEDRIANAHLFTDVQACPPESLPWLGQWIGVAFEPDTPTPRARLMLQNAPWLAQRHGSLQALQRTLDIATDGAVTRGRIVIVENFRLRRTMATILGAQLEDFADPLTAGIARSGNSIVGDTAFLGDENSKTFLALFRKLQADPAATSYIAQKWQDERDAAIHSLYDGLAHRATVLAHDTSDDELGMIKRLVSFSAPAHVAVAVVAAKYPFLVGVAALIGADTYLADAAQSQPVRVDDSQLGYIDTLQGLATLDAAGGAFDLALSAPIADAGPDQQADVGAPFTLDGSRSRAGPGHQLKQYRWNLRPSTPLKSDLPE